MNELYRLARELLYKYEKNRRDWINDESSPNWRDTDLAELDEEITQYRTRLDALKPKGDQ